MSQYEPGSPEYEAEMAARYRAQKDGTQDAALDGGRKASSEYTPEGSTVRIHKGSTLGPTRTNQQRTFSASAADPGQVISLQQEIGRLTEELGEVRGYDPRTGAPIMQLQGEARQARELRKAALEDQLPKVQALQQVASDWRRQNVPTAEQQLQATKDRQDATRRRAEAIADEREAEAMAGRIATERRLKLGIDK